MTFTHARKWVSFGCKTKFDRSSTIFLFHPLKIKLCGNSWILQDVWFVCGTGDERVWSKWETIPTLDIISLIVCYCHPPRGIALKCNLGTWNRVLLGTWNRVLLWHLQMLYMSRSGFSPNYKFDKHEAKNAHCKCLYGAFRLLAKLLA